MSASRIATKSFLTILKASQTAFAFPFFDCSITTMSKSKFSDFILFATSKVLSFDFPIAKIISEIGLFGILSNNICKFPLHSLQEQLLFSLMFYFHCFFSKNYICFYTKVKVIKQ